MPILAIQGLRAELRVRRIHSKILRSLDLPLSFALSLALVLLFDNWEGSVTPQVSAFVWRACSDVGDILGCL